MRSLALALALIAAAGVAAHANSNAKNSLKGDYVEARTASVFAGACHYNGEVVTAGREAEMAWRVKEGDWNGVSLKGLCAIAAVVSDVNLKEEKAERRSVLYIDDKATKEQATALADALKTRYAKALGKVLAIKTAPVLFVRQADNFRVEAKGLTKLSVQAMPNGECCKMPHQVWYEPLISLENRKVGYTESSGIKEKALKTNWEKGRDNTAFYGAFSL